MKRTPCRACCAVAGAVVAALVSVGLDAPAQERRQPVQPLSVFDVPGLVEGQRLVAGLLRLGELDGAERALEALRRRYPSVAILHFETALLKLRQDRKDEALTNLAEAIRAGLPRSILEASPDLKPLRGEPSFEQLLRQAATPTSPPAVQAPQPAAQPREIDNGVADIDASNTAWDPKLGMLRTTFRFPGRDGSAAAEIVANSAKSDTWFSLAAERLNRWIRDGTAAGNYGDLYDNRDGGHSKLPEAIFPDLARVQYGEGARRTGLDRGLNRYLLFNAATIGNASLALTSGPMWRSLPRIALSDRPQVDNLYRQYVSNHLYVYPAHKDYGTPAGDLITANTPYLLISSGSSGSDQPLLKSVAAILAAFKPEVKTFLVQRGLISPTVQWIFRRGQLGIDSDEDYLTGRAHPSAFNGKRINLLDMVERAHSLEAGDIPPMVQLSIREEDQGEAGVGVMYPDGDETLFDTPSAVARIFRATAFSKRLVIDASQTSDPNSRPLTFRWVVLRGDKKKISIRPLNDQGSVAEITVPWTAKPGQPDITGNRVEVGVFANNGKHWSAPAFVSVIFPGNETRSYRSDGKIAEVNYDDPVSQRYVDPILFPARAWRDVYRYNDNGQLLGWTRSRVGATSSFAADGSLVIESDALGRPVRTERIRYQLQRKPDGRFEVIEMPTGIFFSYFYTGNTDMIGTKTKLGPG